MSQSFTALFSCPECRVSFWFVFQQAVAFCPFCGKKGLIESIRVPILERLAGSGSQAESMKGEGK